MDNLQFFFTWMSEPNPMLGGLVPLEMMERGRGDKLATFIRQAMEDEEAAQLFRRSLEVAERT